MIALKTIGILDVQGAVSEHAQSIEACGAKAVLVKHKDELAQVDAIVLPGGESTTIGKLIRAYHLHEALVKRITEGMPVFGTCAGMILLAKHIVQQNDVHLGVMDITVDRNSFGRQRESFEVDLVLQGVAGGPFPTVFIRAPQVQEVGKDVEVLATYQDRIVAVREGSMLATAFHPELTDDHRLHQYFMDMIAQ